MLSWNRTAYRFGTICGFLRNWPCLSAKVRKMRKYLWLLQKFYFPSVFTSPKERLGNQQLLWNVYAISPRTVHLPVSCVSGSLGECACYWSLKYASMRISIYTLWQMFLELLRHQALLGLLHCINFISYFESFIWHREHFFIENGGMVCDHNINT